MEIYILYIHIYTPEEFTLVLWKNERNDRTTYWYKKKDKLGEV